MRVISFATSTASGGRCAALSVCMSKAFSVGQPACVNIVILQRIMPGLYISTCQIKGDLLIKSSLGFSKEPDLGGESGDRPSGCKSPVSIASMAAPTMPGWPWAHRNTSFPPTWKCCAGRWNWTWRLSVFPRQAAASNGPPPSHLLA